MITIDIFYRQLAVFIADMSNPYNNWSTRSFNQGFAYRIGSVSFDTIEDGEFKVYINEENNLNSDKIIRKILVPIQTNNGFEIGSINSTIKIDLSPGNYEIEYSLYENKIIQLKINKREINPEILIMKDKEIVKIEDLFLNEEKA